MDPSNVFKVTPGLVVDNWLNVIFDNVAGSPFKVSFINILANDCPPIPFNTGFPVSLTASITAAETGTETDAWSQLQIAETPQI